MSFCLRTKCGSYILADKVCRDEGWPHFEEASQKMFAVDADWCDWMCKHAHRAGERPLYMSLAAINEFRKFQGAEPLSDPHFVMRYTKFAGKDYVDVPQILALYGCDHIMQVIELMPHDTIGRRMWIDAHCMTTNSGIPNYISRQGFIDIVKFKKPDKMPADWGPLGNQGPRTDEEIDRNCKIIDASWKGVAPFLPGSRV